MERGVFLEQLWFIRAPHTSDAHAAIAAIQIDTQLRNALDEGVGKRHMEKRDARLCETHEQYHLACLNVTLAYSSLTVQLQNKRHWCNLIRLYQTLAALFPSHCGQNGNQLCFSLSSKSSSL